MPAAYQGSQLEQLQKLYFMRQLSQEPHFIHQVKHPAATLLSAGETAASTFC
jgi:hypothetical protein